MTREEERHIAAIRNFPHFAERRVGFIAGAEWADANPDRNTFACISLVSAEQAKKQMIDKACEWLNAFLASHYVMRYHDNCVPVKEYVLEGFRRAMEK